MSWYECPKCGRELTENQAFAGRCKKCGDIVVKVCGKTPEKPLDLNRATALELQRIAGFGARTAAYIVNYRRGRKFTSVSDLRNVRGVGDKTYEKVCGRLYVDEPKQPKVPVVDEQKQEWMLRITDATEWICDFLNKKFPNLWCKLRFEHVDAAAYWYTFELLNDDRRQTWCVRHSDLEG
jgi:competence ComEA-like helix-hairpin-helix protein